MPLSSCWNTLSSKKLEVQSTLKWFTPHTIILCHYYPALDLEPPSGSFSIRHQQWTHGQWPSQVGMHNYISTAQNNSRCWNTFYTHMMEMIVHSDVATHTMPWYGAIISIQPMPLTQTQTKSVCHLSVWCCVLMLMIMTSSTCQKFTPHLTSKLDQGYCDDI